MNIAKTLLYAQCLFLCLMLVGFLSQRYSLLPFKMAFGGFVISMILAAFTAVIALIVLALSFGPVDGAARTSSVGAFVLGAIPLLIMIVVVGGEQFKSPRIHDISTSPGTLEFKHAQTLRKEGENSLELPDHSVIAAQREHYPNIAPILVEDTPSDAFQKSVKTAEALGWTIAHREDARFSFEAFEKTAVFGFTDDVKVKVTATSSGSQIDLRSVSRVGLGDLGANARRIKDFEKKYSSM